MDLSNLFSRMIVLFIYIFVGFIALGILELATDTPGPVLLVLALMSMSLTSAMLWSIYIPGLGKTGRASSANGVLDCTGYIAAAGANLLFAAVSGWASWNTVLLLWASVGAIGVVATLFAKPESRT